MNGSSTRLRLGANLIVAHGNFMSAFLSLRLSGLCHDSPLRTVPSSTLFPPEHRPPSSDAKAAAGALPASRDAYRFVVANSEGSEDGLLPGLCMLTESWLAQVWGKLRCWNPGSQEYDVTYPQLIHIGVTYVLLQVSKVSVALTECCYILDRLVVPRR